ncbi:glutathione S-transferase family protein [Methyloglobulus sp.]|uniref:glutathione S-transferase family protein n=1 Tax=Methyloglobulus sp. TaxID=2518622 RepID=UPI0032B7D1FB
MITHHQFARTWGIPNLSVFCVKVETYLRMNKLPHKIAETLPLKGPRGKLPYIEDDGRKLSDSRLILNYLRATYGDSDQEFLSPEQKSIATAYQRLLEEHLYWVDMITRWNYTEENWQIIKQAIFGGLPPIARDLAATIYRVKIKSQIKGHGIGRLTYEEIFELGKEDIDSLAKFLGNKPYFMGKQPSTLDASAYGVLVNILGSPFKSPLKTHALTKQNLIDYCERVQTGYFPELPWVAVKDGS